MVQAIPLGCFRKSCDISGSSSSIPTKMIVNLFTIYLLVMTQVITACFGAFEHPLWQFFTYQAI